MVSNVSHRHELARLIDEVKQGKQWSDEDLARHARRAGHQISKQHIANLRAQDPLKSLVPATLRALAAGLEVPVPRVVEAALRAAGLPAGAPTDWSIEGAIDADPTLPVAAKRLLKQTVAVARGTDGAAVTVIGAAPRKRAVGRPQPAGKAARKHT